MLSSSKPLPSNSSTASSIISSSSTTRSPRAPTSPATNNKPAKKRKKRNTSTSPFSPSGFRSYSSWLPTWLNHNPLSPNEVIGIASARPLYFAFPKFFAHVVTAPIYIPMTAMPINTNANTITPKGQPSFPLESTVRYVNAARRYPTAEKKPDARASGRGE